MDGACPGNGTPDAKAGMGVFWGDGHNENIGHPASRATNNVAEIEAAIHAIKTAQAYGIDSLNIISDSKYVMNCLITWIPKWKQNGWRTREDTPVQNRHELEELDKVKSGIHIKWTHVKSHSGIYGNDKADALAKEGASKYEQ